MLLTSQLCLYVRVRQKGSLSPMKDLLDFPDVRIALHCATITILSYPRVVISPLCCSCTWWDWMSAMWPGGEKSKGDERNTWAWIKPLNFTECINGHEKCLSANKMTDSVKERSLTVGTASIVALIECFVAAAASEWMNLGMEGMRTLKYLTQKVAYKRIHRAIVKLWNEWQESGGMNTNKKQPTEKPLSPFVVFYPRRSQHIEGCTMFAMLLSIQCYCCKWDNRTWNHCGN